MSLSFDSLYSHAGRFTHEDLQWLAQHQDIQQPTSTISPEVRLKALKKSVLNWGTPFLKSVPEEIISLSEEELLSHYKKNLEELRDEVWNELFISVDALSDKEIHALLSALEKKHKISQEVLHMDFPCGRTSKHTRLMRLLYALLESRSLLSKLPSGVENSLRFHLKQFIWGMLSPQEKVTILDITDVYGEEANVPNAWNDATQIRAYEHWREVQERYGIEVSVYNQGTSINAPEQCGFYAMVALNQARRANLRAYGDGKITPRCVLLNNSARVATADGIQEGAEASKSTALLYFRFDLGDGVEHYGVTYGHATLTYLKPYITELWELPQTEAGTQFRSLEYEKHIGVVVAMTGGALPLCYQVRPLFIRGWGSLSLIPSLDLPKNGFQYLGVDKYGNAITGVPASDIFSQWLPTDVQAQEIMVTIYDRTMSTVLVEKSPYILAKSLGSIRNGGHALWESSTPCTGNPLQGFLSLGVFKKETHDVNPHVLEHTIPAGSIIILEK